MALTIEFSRRSTNQLKKILTFYDERNGSDNYRDHGVGSSDHFQESVILIMIHYCLNSHIICLDK